MKKNLKNLVPITDLLDRAQKAFEKKSGWKSKDVKVTLSNFSRLNRVNQVFFGGLLVGQAIVNAKPSKGSRSRTTVARTMKRKNSEVSLPA